MSTPPTSVVGGHFGDTTYTKVFVGGLAWETQRETMKEYFEQFGEILEAVVITDKTTGRSKGYGFVTFREPEAAMRACVDPSPVIDGRRANCNLASLGVQRTRPKTPQYGGSRSNIRVMKAYQYHQSAAAGLQGGMGTAFSSPSTFPHYAVQHGIPYNIYGYPPFSPEYAYPTSYYNLYGGANAQYQVYGGAAFYPYFQFGQASGTGTYANGSGYGAMQYPQMYQYSAMESVAGVTAGLPAQYYGGPATITPTTTAQPGMTVALTTPALPSPTAHHYRLIPPHFSASTAPEQPLA